MAGLLFAISDHGLGHLGQVAPVCEAIHDLRPDLPLTIWSALPTAVLNARITAPFRHIHEACDIGFVMQDALHVDVSGSWTHYAQRHAEWAASLSTACQIVQRIDPNLVISDVGEMPLAAAQQLGIPDIAMSSLNWADLAHHYFQDIDGAAPVLSKLRDIYDNTRLALRLTPGMPMRGLEERIVPPVAEVCRQSRATLRQKLLAHISATSQNRPLLLIGMGGIDYPLPLSDWPTQADYTLIVANQPLPENGLPERGVINATTLQHRTGLRFSEILAASDVVICKPGYGTFAEAALAKTPVLYVRRPEWPEQRVLIDWLEAHACCAELPLTDLMQGHFQQAMMALCTHPEKPAIPNDGALIAAREILSLLDGSLKNESLKVPAIALFHEPANP
jgi:hypothetical protein